MLPHHACHRLVSGLALLLVAVFNVGIALAEEQDVLFYNGRVFTADPEHPYAEAVAIRGERIVGVGALADVTRQIGPAARRVDLGQHFLMPGMIDAHAHPIYGGLQLNQLRYSAEDGSIPNLVAFVGSKLPGVGADQVLIVNDLDIRIWSQAAAIDDALSHGAFAQRRIVLYGNDGHTAWANAQARLKAGLTPDFLKHLPDSQRRFYGHDQHFNPNGFVVDAGKSRLMASLPPVSLEQLIAGGHAALKFMNALGITGWLDAAPAGVVGGDTPLSVSSPGVLPAYKALGERGELTAHVVGYPVVKPDLGAAQIDVVQKLQAQYANIPNFRIPGLKVFADGVVEFPSQTASLTKPYLNSGREVLPLFTPEKMNALVVEAYRRGLTVHVHAIGDLAVKRSLDAFEAARRANPGTRLPFVLTHAQFVDPEDIPRFGSLHVIAALQLLWAVADSSTNEVVKPYIDPGIYRWMYPARSMLDTGAVIAGASDWPVSSPNPFLAIYQAETRSGAQGVLDETQRMPREAMLYAYTRNAAAVLDMQQDIGTITQGKLADLVLVDRDILTVPSEQLKDAKVIWTLFGGKAVYGTAP
ncbi:MAG TPA: amidohydrolase [Steroidobacteraceae bacterium]|nr:amidohydrolase [Steroidobacteraceae bacterium]